MNNEFWDRMEGVSQVMTDLENEHKRFFSIDEEIKLLNYKENFVKSVLFWSESSASDEEKTDRIRWEYNNMFDNLVQIIDNNVEEWENNPDNNRNDDYDIEIYNEEDWNEGQNNSEEF
tara:strand:- start:3596 stop:3949 length:354 start_codon:yes stop_codon:yes gene_type:complete